MQTLHGECVEVGLREISFETMKWGELAQDWVL
jgi:hypothetical protein